MTSPAPPAVKSATAGILNSRRSQFLRFPTAVALTGLGAISVLSAVVDVFDDAEVTFEFLVLAVLFGPIGGMELKRLKRPEVASAPAVLTMTTIVWLLLAIGATVAHLVSGATHEVDTAVFEGMAAASTTAMTALDADSLPMGMLMFRALVQWAGGLSALVLAVVLLPLVLGGREFDGRGLSRTMSRTMITGRTQGIHRIAVIYFGFTVAMLAAFQGVGLGLFDASAHALTTVSSGGLSTRTDSLAAFDKAGVEWVAATGMGLAGTSIGIVWWALHRDVTSIRRSTEFRVYVAVMAASLVAITLWLSDGSISLGSVRTGFFAVASAMSTTGFTTTPWGTFDHGAQTMLLVLVAVGAMAGSAGGGFRHIRTIEAFGFAKRELKRQLHPTAVSVVRLNGRAVSEQSLERLNGYIVVYLVTLIVGAMAISVGTQAIAPQSALTLSISALSTAGPQLVNPVELAELAAVSKVSLAALMLLGRLSIYAVILAVSNTGARIGRAFAARSRDSR